ncbi:MAG: arylsulfatase [Cyclobacteriaceae bacterium]
MKPNYLSYLLLFAVLLFSCQPQPSGGSENEKPNVIYIFADDLGYGDLSIFGQEKLQTPNIDRLGNEGLIFTNHYSGNTVCSPSRAVLMTGIDPGHISVRGNAGEDNPSVHLDPNMITLPRLFKNAGYNTGIFGKWGLGYTYLEGKPNPLTHGFDEYFGPRTQSTAHTYYTDTLVHNGIQIPVDTTIYMHDLIMDHAINFIRKSAEAKKPFFCYIPTPIPHAAMHAPADLHQKWREKLPQYDTIIGKYGAAGDPCPDVINPIAGFGAMMESLDNEVGRILSTLKDLGVDENTLIIFASDNGAHLEGGHDPIYWNSNGPFRGHKRDLYEGGIHSPCLIRWPAKVKAGITSDHISALQDVLPTMAEVTGQEIPEQVKGISFLPTMLGDEASQKKHDFLFFEFTVGREQRVVSQAVRMGDWKAVRTVWKKSKEEQEAPVSDWPVELYNLKEDIGEKNDLAGEHPELVAEAKMLMTEARVDITEN